MDNLDYDNNGQASFVEVGSASAWHRLGHLGAHDMSAVDGTHVIGDPRAEKRQLWIFDDDGGLHPSQYWTIARTDRPEWKLSGAEVKEYAAVTKDYVHLTPGDFAVACDIGSEGRTISTMGLLNTGVMFVSYKLPDQVVAGEESRDFLVLLNAMNGREANMAHICKVMPVCENTVRAGVQAATYLMKIRHDQDAMNNMVAEIRGAFARSAENQDKVKVELELLAACVLSPEQAYEVAVEAAGFPPEPKAAEANALRYNEAKAKVYEQAVLLAQARAQTIMGLFEGGMAGYAEYPARRGTGYGMLQAILQAYEHEIPAKNSQERVQAFLGGIRLQRIEQAGKVLRKICK